MGWLKRQKKNVAVLAALCVVGTAQAAGTTAANPHVIGLFVWVVDLWRLLTKWGEYVIIGVEG